MRAKTEYVMEVTEKGKQAPKKVGLAPVQRDGMDYEFTIVLDIDVATHQATSSKDRTGLFDGQIFKPTRETGETLLQWLNDGVDAPDYDAILNGVEASPDTEMLKANYLAAKELLPERLLANLESVKVKRYYELNPPQPKG